MKLTKISARNLKGLSFDLDLSAGVILVGSNFAGKSARTDAIRLLLLGYLPELGKLPKATFGLSSARTMEVRGLFDNGVEIWRRWTLKGDSIKTEDNLEQVPIDLGFFGVMLNAETYFALSETERIKYVFGLLSASDVDVDPIELVGKLRTELKEQKAEAVETLIVEVDGSILPSARATPQGYLEEFLALTVDRAKALRAESQRMEKTVQGLAQLRLADVPGGRRLEEIDAELASLTRAIDELSEKKGRFASAYGQMIKDRDRRKEIGTELRRIDGSLDGLPSLKKLLAHCEKKIGETKLPLTPKGEAETRDILSGIKMDDTLARKEIADADTAIDVSRTALFELGSKLTCPYCGAAGSGWKVLKTAELEQTISSAGAKKAGFVKARETYKAGIENAEALLARAGETSDLLEALNDEHSRLSRQIAALEPAQSRAQTLREESDRLMPDDANLTTAVELVQTELNVKNEAVRKLRSGRAAVASRAAELTRLAEAEKARDEAIEAKAVADDAVEAIRKVQAELVAAAFKPLLATANELFGKILPTPIAYHDREIGTFRSGVWVGHKIFSGTEKALTYAAIQIALAARAPFRLMILDELGRLDDENAMKVDEAIVVAIKTGAIEQFIGIDAGRPALHRRLREKKKDALELVPCFNVISIN